MAWKEVSWMVGLTTLCFPPSAYCFIPLLCPVTSFNQFRVLANIHVNGQEESVGKHVGGEV